MDYDVFMEMEKIMTRIKREQSVSLFIRQQPMHTQK